MFEQLMALAEQYYARAENPPLTPWVFAIQCGKLVGRCYKQNGEVGLDYAAV